ncbi:MAG: ribonuclease H [Candidatus Peregrinibacteria bacterium Greene0416_19]|nr:MAG: ribonuclease H [Candidatus Peregrinibacteria bacterium Greene0416_19]
MGAVIDQCFVGPCLTCHPRPWRALSLMMVFVFSSSILIFMIRLPAALERLLAELFPRMRERDEFVIRAIEEALGEDAPEETEPKAVGGTLHLFTDGGSRGNPGQAAIAAILEDPTRGETLKQYAGRIGIETNNIAEYRALIEGLKMARQFHPNRLICHLDAELVVKQLNGEYRVKMLTFEPLVQEIRDLSMDFPDIVFKHIPRGDNYRADALVNKVLDEHPSPSYKPPRH